MTEEEEYVDCTFTVGIALAIARKYKEPLDETVRRCSLALTKRIQYQRVRNLFLGISLDPTPAATFTMISNQVFSSGLIVPVVAPRASMVGNTRQGFLSWGNQNYHEPE